MVGGKQTSEFLRFVIGVIIGKSFTSSSYKVTGSNGGGGALGGRGGCGGRGGAPGGLGE